MDYKFAEIIISLSAKQVDKPFTYKIPDELKRILKKGMRVVVPFGKANKKYEGYIVNLTNDIKTEYDIAKIKYILSAVDGNKMFADDILALAFWMSEKYFTTFSECLKCIMPAGISYKNDVVYQVSDKEGTLSEQQKQIMDFLKEHEGSLSHDKIIKKFGTGITSALNLLIKNGFIIKSEKETAKNFVQTLKFAKCTQNFSEEDENFLTLKGKQPAVLTYLLKNGETSVKDIKAELNLTDSPLLSLAKKGLIVLFDKEIRRETADFKYIEKSDFQWTDEQKEAIADIKSYINEEKAPKKPVLIHGVTGSGKTEVYLSLIEGVLKEGKQAIVLVPEISLTPQTVSRFVGRFGDKVSVTHSKLSMGERFDQWKNASEGKISVMIGPRSAVFTPFSSLGIIVIDEEHEHTYKSETTPKYDAREVAEKRAELCNAVVVLGSATPSMTSYYKAVNGNYKLVNMDTRVNSQMPEVHVVDMRKELIKGNRSIFSKQLYEAIKHNIENNYQTILFLNRRGHSTFVSCRQCGYVVECEECSINYTYHLYSDKLICHYCGKEAKNPENCPQCGSKYIKYFGAGTQKIEDEIKSLFPAVPVLRMDMDTTSKKNSHARILSEFRKGNAKILIGTQMIAKGLDFPNVTLVGVVAADVSLNAADYKSGENTFQLLTQVAGRAGRGDALGKVFIQTYNPEHYAVEYAKSGDYRAFYSHEIALRRQMNYPPYTHIFTVLFIGDSEKKIIESLFKLTDIMKYYNKSGDFETLGPAPAFVSKIKNKFRWKLIVKCNDETRLKNYVLYCIDKLKATQDISNININLSLDPLTSV